MISPKISVIMAAYNAEKHIRESIESVIRQTYRNWELIVIDDGSTDQTSSLVKKLQDSDSRIVYSFQENGKQGKARNKGISLSIGKYIAFLDSDDLWVKEKLQLQITEMIQSPHIDLLFSPGYQIINKEVQNFDVEIRDLWDESQIANLVQNNQIPILSVMVKKEALKAVKFFTEVPAIQNVEDYHLWLKLIFTGHKFKSLKERLFYYRIHPGQATYRNQNEPESLLSNFEDLFYLYPNDKIRKIILNRLKWLIFKKEHYQNIQKMAVIYFNETGNKTISFFIENFCSANNHLTQRAIFQLFKIYS